MKCLLGGCSCILAHFSHFLLLCALYSEACHRIGEYNQRDSAHLLLSLLVLPCDVRGHLKVAYATSENSTDCPTGYS